jgi:ketosteroid isomerase-like protein
VEIARAGVEAFNRGDFDAALANAHDEVVWHVYLSADGTVAHGRDEVRRVWEETEDIFRGFQVEVDEYVEEGDYVIAVGRFRGRAPGADTPELSSPIAQRFHIRDGRLAEVRSFRSLEEALAAIRDGD